LKASSEGRKKMNPELLRKFVDLKAEKARLESALEQIKDQLGETEKKLLDCFGELGIDSTRFNGSTIFIKRSLFPKIVEGDRKAAALALKDAGLGDLLKEDFNLQTLRSFINERDKNDEPLPESFKGIIETSEVFTLGVRASGNGTKTPKKERDHTAPF